MGNAPTLAQERTYYHQRGWAGRSSDARRGGASRPPIFYEIGAFHVPHKGRGCKPGRLTASLGDPIGRGGESPTQGEIPRPLCALRFHFGALAPNAYASLDF